MNNNKKLSIEKFDFNFQNRIPVNDIVKTIENLDIVRNLQFKIYQNRWRAYIVVFEMSNNNYYS